MKHDAVERYLASQPPQLWPAGITQGTEIEQYLRRGIFSDHNAIASKLNISRRQLYYYIAQFKAAQTCDSLTFRHGQHSILAPRLNAIIENAINELGENSRETDVFAKVLQDCEIEGISPPSMGPVYARMSRAPVKPDLIQRLGRHGDLVIDHCKLDLLAVGNDGEVLPVFVCGIIEMKTGVVLKHLTVTSLPALDEALSLLDAATQYIKSHEQSLVLLSSIDLPQAPDSRAAAALNELKLIFVRKEASSGWPGRAWASTFGRRLGRIPFCQRHDRKIRNREPIPLTYVRGVVNILVERANSRQAA